MQTRKYREACERGVAWCLAQQQPDGSIRTPERCLDGLYKFPAAFMVTGRQTEALRLLRWIEETLLQPDGELRFPERKVLFEWHARFYMYTNSWIALGAQRAGAFRLANCCVDHFLKFQNPTTGLFQSGPMSNGPDRSCDTTITGNCGIAALFAGRMREARLAADGLCNTTHQQDGGPVFYFRTDAGGKILRETGGENPLWCFIDQRQTGQCYWYVGISAALLAHTYSLTGREEYLSCARENLDFLLGCAPDVLQSFASGKLGYAAALLHGLTGDESYRSAATSLIDWLTAVQKPDGRWGPDVADYPWYFEQDCTAEMVYWISEIVGLLQSPRKAVAAPRPTAALASR